MMSLLKNVFVLLASVSIIGAKSFAQNSHDNAASLGAAPIVTSHPVNQTAIAGSGTTFSVTVSGAGPLTYQWKRGKNSIAGATTASYTIAVTTPADSGAKFRCAVSNAFGAALSDEAILTVNSGVPVILLHPQNQTVAEGQTATLTTSATGPAPLAYRWQKNRSNIAGATNPSYTTSSTVIGDNGALFRCIVTSAYGTATSNAAMLTVTGVAPGVLQHPRDTTVLAGRTAFFSITASGTLPRGYQWQKNSVNIAGATNASYTTPSTSISDNGALFRCVVSNAYGTVSSNAALLTVAVVPPSITQQPRDTTVAEGQSGLFSVVASGTLPLTYQWQKNSVNIAGATNSSYNTPSTVISDNGALFRCIVTNDYGTATSSTATLTVTGIAPTITQHPRDTTVVEGQTASFTIASSGTLPRGYQWQKNTVNIAGATNSSYNTPSTVIGDNGMQFRCIVTNAYGTVTSNAALLTVTGISPSVTQQPRDTTVVEGQTASFSIIAGGTLPRVYQWQKNGVNIAGATNAAYTTPSTVVGDNGSQFRCVVTNAFGTATSNAGALTVTGIPPSVTLQPRDTTVVDGQAAFFSVTAAGTLPLAYQWQKNTANIAGATNSSYTTPSTVIGDNGSQFRCVVTNAFGTATSNAATLTVTGVSPTITQQPRDTTVLSGLTAFFSVTVSGSLPLGYQWQKNSVNVAGATNASYTTPATVIGDNSAQFRCIVTNAFGTVTSNAAVLTVAVVPPNVTQHPRDTTVAEGQTAFFSVAASGTSPLAYQWQKNSVNIAGATGTTYTTPPSIISDNGSLFRCIVTSAYGTATSNAAVLTITGIAPGITQQPRDTTVVEGQTGFFGVAASGTLPRLYQWQKNNVNIAGATNASHTTPSSLIGDNGALFRCIVSNAYGTVTSSAAVLTVTGIAPGVAQHPRDTTVAEGQTASFSVTASGTLPFSYQWQKNNANIAGATGASYVTPATVIGDSGSQFRCIVTNAFGTVTSNAAVLSITGVAPAIVQHPRDTTMLAGQAAFFSVTATGTLPRLYQWQKNSVDVVGATNASYTTPATVIGDNGSQFTCVVANAFGTVTSNAALLTVAVVPPSIFQQPRDTTVAEGQTASFSVAASGTLPFNYQWQKNSVNIAGATNASYITPGTVIGDSGSLFRCIVTNGYGTATSNAAILTVTGIAPAVAQHPRDTTVVEGQAAFFSVAATGTMSRLYQWQKNNVNISGATNTGYTTPATVVSDNGSQFRCIVTNPYGTVTSNSAVLSVSGIVPGITQQPRDTTVVEGQTAFFSIVASGTVPLAYQWQKNSVNIAGATNTSYTSPATVIGDNGSQFRCVVTNVFGTATSNAAVLTVSGIAPTVTLHPRDTTVVEGQTAFFSVTASGTLPLSYQWQKNSVDVAGATNANYTTPATVQADSGATFRCLVSSAFGTVTSNAAILNVLPLTSSIASDDFRTGTLNASLWTYINPFADVPLSFAGAGTSDALLQMALPLGTPHDLYTNGYQVPRIMQNANNADFTVEAKFQSTFTGQFQSEGIVAEQDANNIIRFDIYYDGIQTGIFAASFSGGFAAPVVHVNTGIAGAALNPVYLRVNRTGNQWTLSYSLDGTTFTPAVAFTLPFALTKIGVWAGNSGTNPAFTMKCDYFFNTASPLNPEDPLVPAITTQPSNQSVTLGNAATFSIVAGGAAPLTYQWQKNNVDIAGATTNSYTTPATIQGDSGATFCCIVTNPFGTATSNAAILNVVPASVSTIVSDDFRAGTLNTSLWTYINPLADVTLSFTGVGTSDALLQMAIPSGSAHDLYTNGYQVPRIMQNVNNSDFTIEAKFQSSFTGQFQSEGIVAEQDANNVIRFDIFFDGVNTNIFAASFSGGFATPTIHVNTGIAAGALNPAYMRVNRAGNQWTLSYSFDGTVFTTAGTFALPFTLTKVGVWAGNSGTNPAFTMTCDYFFNTASPIVPEDSTGLGSAPNITTQPTNQTVAEGSVATFTLVATGNPTPTYQWQKNTVNIGGATNANYTTPATIAADSGAAFRCIVSNTSGTVTSNSAILNVVAGPPASSILSDDFSTGALNGMWTYTNPLNDATLSFGGVGTTDARLSLTVPAGTDHTLYTNVNTVPRIMQSVSNSDLAIEVKIESNRTSAFQEQGVLVEQDGNNLLRIDAYYDGANTQLIGIAFSGGLGSPVTVFGPINLGGAINPLWLRVNRIGNAWTLSTSTNGTTFTTHPTFNHTITMTKIGLFVGNEGAPAPAYSAVFDYFFNVASPINPEDPVGSGAPVIVQQPANVTAGDNSSATFMVGVTGVAPMAYQWQKNSIDIGGATGSVYAIPSVALADNGSTFRCIVTNGSGTATSNAATLTVVSGTMPIITSHPLNRSVVAPLSATFYVVASGSAPLAYQWQRDNSDIAGATNASYATGTTTVADNGATFRCIVSNSLGTASSNLATLTVTAAPVGQSISDDFSAPSLNSALWTITNPGTPSTIGVIGTGTTDALLSIAIPAGNAHDVWTGGNQAPHIMQAIQDQDFTVEAKFQSVIGQRYQLQGIIVEQDVNNFIRVDFFHDGTNLGIFAATFVADVPTARISNTLFGGTNPIWLRVARVGTSWTISTSTDGTSFTSAGSFSHTLTTSAVGVFAGNQGDTPTTAPAFTMLCDYFFNTASPISQEDPTSSTTMDIARSTIGGGEPVGTVTAAVELPKEFALHQNYPNPLNPSTTIRYDLPKDAQVTLTMYNMLGQEVATLVDEQLTAGRYSIQWNAQGFASGVYLYRMQAGSHVETRKLVLLK